MAVFVSVGYRNLNNEQIYTVRGLFVWSHITKALKELTWNLNRTESALIVKEYRK